jgi:hypothetical protein
MTDAAERRETSCSPDRPPYTTPTRNRLFMLLSWHRGACITRRLRVAPMIISDRD